MSQEKNKYGVGLWKTFGVGMEASPPTYKTRTILGFCAMLSAWQNTWISQSVQ